MTELVIISVFYNRAAEVSTSVRSIISAAPINARIFLVNDGSTDSTLEELVKFSATANVHIINKINSGFTESLRSTINEVLRTINPKYIAIHGAGDVAHEDKFRTQLKFLNENSTVAAVGCGHLLKSVNNPSSIIAELKGATEASYTTLQKTVPFTHGTVMYASSAYLASGGYNSFLKYCQDWDLYFRICKFGKIVRLPEPMYSKFIFEDGVSFAPHKKIGQIRHSRAIVKHYQENRDIDLTEVEFNRLLSILSRKSLSKEYKRQQLSLIKKKEYKLAREWTPYIAVNISGKIDQFLKSILISVFSKIFPASAD